MKKIAVIGAGISGLATAFQIQKRLQQAGVDHDIQIFEKEPKTGGKIGAMIKDGFRCEAGPNGFLDSKPSTLELCEELGITDQLLKSSDAARRRFIYSRSRLQKIPTSPLQFIGSNLISLSGKLRLLGETWAAGPPIGVDQTIAEFARRRLGEEAYAKLIDPMVAGVFAGDAERLSLESCFPRMAELERDYGGLVKAVFKIPMERRRQREKNKPKTGGGRAGPGGTLTSFRDGLSVLPDTLARRFDGKVICNAGLNEIVRNANGYRLASSRFGEYQCDGIIIATPAFDAAALLRSVDQKLSGVLYQFEYAPVTVVGIGYDKRTVNTDLNGFGFLMPKSERRRILGSLWTSSIFSHRAPDDSVLLRNIVGGARSPELALLPDEKIIDMVRKELSDILGITAEPTFVQVFRWDKAICQYTVGHQYRLKEIDDRLKNYPGLFITGNAYKGVSINDCTANASIIATDVANYFTTLI